MKKGINRNQLRGGVVLSYISKIIKVVIGLLYTPVMIGLLGQSEYGLYNIAASLVAYLGLLNFGFGSSYVRFFSQYKVNGEEKKIENLNAMSLIIFSLMGAIAVIAGIILSYNVDIFFGASLSSNEINTAQTLMRVLVINLAVSFPNIVFDNYMQANERFIAANILEIIRQVSSPLLSLPLLLSGWGSLGYVAALTFVNITVELLTVYYCFRNLDMKFSLEEFDTSLFKEMSKYSFYIFINMIVDQVNNNLDKTILGRYKGTISVAVYSVGANINSYYTQVSTSISNVFTPRIHKMESEQVSDESFSELFIRVGRVQFVVIALICTCFFFFGKTFILLWVGEKYINSYWVALILMVTVSIALIQNIGIEIQRAKNKHQFRSMLYILMAIGNALISVPLSIKYGEIGASVGTAISYLLGNGLIMNIYNHKVIGLDIIKFWKEILKLTPALILPILFGSFVTRHVDINKLSVFIVIVVIFVIIYLASMWVIGLNEYEKSLVNFKRRRN